MMEQADFGLYSVNYSPFGIRVRMALRHKGLDWTDLPLPDGGLHGAAFRRINPLGRIPVLVTPDGAAICESETSLGYLEQIRPDPSLLSADPLYNMALRTAGRIMDNYIVPPMQRLAGQIGASPRNQPLIASELERWRHGMDNLAACATGDFYLIGGRLSWADLMVFPGLDLCLTIGGLLGIDDLLAPYPSLATYYQRLPDDPAVAVTVAELRTAQQARMRERRWPS